MTRWGSHVLEADNDPLGVTRPRLKRPFGRGPES